MSRFRYYKGVKFVAANKPAPAHFEQRAGFFYFRPNHFAAFGRRCGQPGQQQGRRSPAFKSATSRSICSLRVAASLT